MILGSVECFYLLEQLPCGLTHIGSSRDSVSNARRVDEAKVDEMRMRRNNDRGGSIAGHHGVTLITRALAISWMVLDSELCLSCAVVSCVRVGSTFKSLMLLILTNIMQADPGRHASPCRVLKPGK